MKPLSLITDRMARHFANCLLSAPLLLLLLAGRPSRSDMCGSPTAHRSMVLRGATRIVINVRANISNGQCLEQCCAIADCNYTTYKNFMSSPGECELYTCAEAAACTLRRARPAEASAGLITIEVRRPAAKGRRPSDVADDNRTAAHDRSGVSADANGTGEWRNATSVPPRPAVVTILRSCATPLGLAVFVAVFCLVLNAGLSAALCCRRRGATGKWDAQGERNGAARQQQQRGGQRATGGGGANGTLHAYNHMPA